MNYLDKEGLTHFWDKIKSKIPSRISISITDEQWENMVDGEVIIEVPTEIHEATYVDVTATEQVVTFTQFLSQSTENMTAFYVFNMNGFLVLLCQEHTGMFGYFPIPTELSQLTTDPTHRVVTDTEKKIWNNKSDFSGSYNDLTDKPTIPTVPTKISDFENDKGYLTMESDPSVPSHVKSITTTDISNWNNKLPLSGGVVTGNFDAKKYYIDGTSFTAIDKDEKYLSVGSSSNSTRITSVDAPGWYKSGKLQGTFALTKDIPSKTSQLTNDSGFSSVSQSQGTLTVSGWASNSQTISVNGVTTSNIIWVAPNPATQEAYTNAGVLCTTQGNGTLTFTCTETPAEEILVNVVIGG